MTWNFAGAGVCEERRKDGGIERGRDREKEGWRDRETGGAKFSRRSISPSLHLTISPSFRLSISLSVFKSALLERRRQTRLRGGHNRRSKSQPGLAAIQGARQRRI